MYVIIWQYQVKADRIGEFEKIYGAHGAWAQLFKKDAGFLGTELLRDEQRPQHFITMDRWSSSEHYENFKLNFLEEYESLDASCAGLTERESLVGKYELVP